MNKSLFFILVLLMVGGIWYNQDALRVYFTRNNIDDVSLVAPTAAEPEESIAKAEEKSYEELLKERALEVANRPINVTAELLPAMEKLAREKIANAASMIVDDYNYDTPWLELGAYRKIIGDYEGAIQAWLFLSEIRPNAFVPLHNIGDIYAFTLKNYNKGEQYLLGSLELNEGNIQGYTALASLYNNVPEFGKRDKVDDILFRGLKVDGNNLMLLTTLASYYRDIGARELARVYFKKALAVSPDNASILSEITALQK